MFPFSKSLDHEHMAAAVRELGPQLFRQLVALKPKTGFNNGFGWERRISKQFDRLTVLEPNDLHRACRSGAYFGRELAVLRYLRDHIRHVGRIVGTETTVAGRYGETHGYYVVSLQDIESYNGEPRNLQVGGNLVIVAIIAAFFGFIGFLGGFGCLHKLLDWSPVSPVTIAFGAVCAVAVATPVACFFYFDTARQTTDDAALAALSE